MRPATTLIELVIVLALLALIAGFALPRARDAADRAAVHAAGARLSMSLVESRRVALLRQRAVTLTVDTLRNTVRLVVEGRAFSIHSLGAPPLTVTASRPEVTYAATGLGLGGSNTTLILRRGRAADTITVSRLGRVRH